MFSLDPNATKFSLRNAIACAEFSAAAYQPNAGGQLAQHGWGLVASISEPSTSTEVIVAQSTLLPVPTLVIAFRGTQQIKDWFTDAKVRRTDDGIHRGFEWALESVFERLETILAQWKGRVFITGHSLGGALALLLTASLDWTPNASPQCYTFGAPRVGDGGFARFYQEGADTYRVVHDVDPIPRLPGFLMGYRHCGQEIFLPSGAGITENPPLLAKLASDGESIIKAWLEDHGLAVLKVLGDHSIEGSYIPRLKQEANRVTR